MHKILCMLIWKEGGQDYQTQRIYVDSIFLSYVDFFSSDVLYCVCVKQDLAVGKAKRLMKETYHTRSMFSRPFS